MAIFAQHFPIEFERYVRSHLTPAWLRSRVSVCSVFLWSLRHKPHSPALGHPDWVVIRRRDTHYFQNSTGGDVEPAAQIPDPTGDCCNNAAQVGAFKQVVAYHDLCDHDDLPFYVEAGLHDHEAQCEAHFCNAVGPNYNGAACPSPPAPPPPPIDTGISVGAVVGIVVAAVVVVVLLLMFIACMGMRERAGKPIFTTVSAPGGATPAAGATSTKTDTAGV